MLAHMGEVYKKEAIVNKFELISIESIYFLIIIFEEVKKKMCWVERNFYTLWSHTTCENLKAKYWFHLLFAYILERLMYSKWFDYSSIGEH